MIIIRVFTEKEIKEICDLYVKDKVSIIQISKTYNTYPTRIRNLLVENNIDIIKHPKIINKFLNENFFEMIDSEAKAYFLGLLFTDGTVIQKKNSASITIRLELQKEDSDILERFRQELNLTSPLTYTSHIRNGKASESVVLTFCSAKMAEDLKQYGIIPNKTYLTNHLPTISPEYKRHFLRGAFDGDGSIYTSKSFNKKYQKYYNKQAMYFCSYHFTCCEDFQFAVFKNLSRKKEMNIRQENCSQYRVTWTALQDVKDLATYLYKDSTFYLKRKYQIAQNFF